MYDTALLFLSEHGFIPKSWCKHLVKVTVEATPTNNFFPLAEKINDWLDNFYFIPPNIAYLGLYSAAVMAWFVLTGMSDNTKDESVKSMEEKHYLKKDSNLDRKVVRKKHETEKVQDDAKEESKSGVDKDVAKILESVVVESVDVNQEYEEIVESNREKDIGSDNAESSMDTSALHMIIPQCESVEEKREVQPRMLRTSPSNANKGALATIPKPIVRSERSILNLRNMQRQAPRKVSQGIVRVVDDHQDLDVVSDTSKEFDNEFIESKEDLAHPIRFERNNSDGSGTAMEVFAGIVGEIQSGHKGVDKVNALRVNGKVPVIVIRPYPRSAPAPHKSFRLGGSIRKSRSANVGQKEIRHAKPE